MDIKLLSNDELLVELEVRDLLKAGEREITPALEGALEEKLKAEQEDPLCCPVVKAHEAALKQPQREVENLAKKLIALQEVLMGMSAEEMTVDKILPRVRTRLIHVQGRISRSAGSPTFNSIAGSLVKSWRALWSLALDLKSKKLDVIGFREAVSKWGIVLPRHKSVPEKFTRRNPGAGLDGNEYGGDDENPLDPDVTSPQPRLLLGTGFIDQVENLNLDNDVNACSTRAGPGANLDVGEWSALQGRSGKWNDVRLRQEVKTWKVRFTGLNSSLTIERFLARVEWHAWRAQIYLDELVGVLDLCLEEEALDWFWTVVDRDSGTTWKALKCEMFLRFGTSRTDDDVRRAMNDRKQLFPRERFQEFYQAILKLASQANKVIPDGQVYTILRRNMRPGLQMALHNEDGFRSLADFVRRCSSLEEMWRRFGNNPEIGLSGLGQGNARDNYRFPVRQQVRFDTRPARVNEMIYLDNEMEDPDTYEDYQDGELPDHAEQVCEISPWSKARPPTQVQQPRVSNGTIPKSPQSGHATEPGTQVPATTAHRAGRNNHCWNCEDPSHSYHDCRRPTTGVFCYGCGTRGVYKLDCTRCTPAENRQREIRNYRDPYLSRSRLRATTEESASNTDPELYLSWRRH